MELFPVEAGKCLKTCCECLSKARSKACVIPPGLQGCKSCRRTFPVAEFHGRKTCEDCLHKKRESKKRKASECPPGFKHCSSGPHNAPLSCFDEGKDTCREHAAKAATRTCVSRQLRDISMGSFAELLGNESTTSLFEDSSTVALETAEGHLSGATLANDILQQPSDDRVIEGTGEVHHGSFAGEEIVAVHSSDAANPGYRMHDILCFCLRLIQLILCDIPQTISVSASVT